MSKELIDGISFSIEPGGNLFLPRHIEDQLIDLRQCDSSDTEAGGILLGRQFENKPDIIVDEITKPFPSDTRTRHSFFRSKAHHDYAVKRYKQSKQCCLYLGLWHTHPEPIPSPSSIDYHDWEKAMTNGEFEGDNLLFVIVGTEATCCWQGSRASIFKRCIGYKHKFIKMSESHE